MAHSVSIEEIHEPSGSRGGLALFDSPYLLVPVDRNKSDNLGPFTAHLASHKADPFSAASPPHDYTPSGVCLLDRLRWANAANTNFRYSAPDLDPGLTRSRPSTKALGGHCRIEHTDDTPPLASAASIKLMEALAEAEEDLQLDDGAMAGSVDEYEP
ncbi:hypothetical protein K438DRAFT_1994238 [Mycena galopus ATCC 62051]|nr:hypothetical protein K438DRAFT_1994238 [Mycena galopus ATCC 62051]